MSDKRGKMFAATSFDIFRIDHEGMVWCEAAATLESAKARVALLAAGSASKQYLIFNQATQQSIYVTAGQPV